MKRTFFSLTLTFLALFAIFLLGCNPKTERPILRFGLTADIQYADCEPRGSRFYKNSLEKLDSCVADLNRDEVEFTIDLGDVIDRDQADFAPVLMRLDRLDAPRYHVVGNHDYSGVTDNDALYKLLKMPSEYYSFSTKGWRFILLNTNEVAAYANVAGTWKEQELEALFAQIKADGRKNGATYNGGISSRQFLWLKEQLEEAQKEDEQVLIFSHHPLFPHSEFSALNDQEMVDLITPYRCVKAVFSGHHHAGAHGKVGDLLFITTEGMCETETENAYGVVDIFEDRLVLTGIGRTRSYTIPLR